MTSSTNPLLKHFRQPQLYVRLPSEGKYYPQGTLDFPITKELAVYSMTAKDEIIWKTPDALLNGQATVDVIHSCVPSIKNAWKMPNVDIDAVIIAIRRATYGNNMDFATICPHCQRKNEQQLNLELLSSRFTPITFDESIKIEGLEIFIQPQNYEQINKANIEKFEQQRIFTILQDEDLPEEDKVKKFNATFMRLLDLTVEQISTSVLAVKLEDGTLVDNPAFIHEFLKNCSKDIWNAVKSALEKISKQSPITDIHLVCLHEDCAKEYNTPLMFEMTNFFG